LTATANPEFTLLGDALWLDFINTARGRTLAPPDLLPDVEAYTRWVQAERLEIEGETPIAVIRGLRDHLTALAEALHAGIQPPGGAIAAINALLSRTSGSHQLTRIGGAWRLRFAPSRLPGTLEAIARSAAATLADAVTTVHRCAGETCSLFFADDSPSQSRRWCDATICGQGGRVERRRGLLR
jgi:predicted RNA-binding Zn ribbon-like protein